MPHPSNPTANIAKNVAQIQQNILEFCEKYHRDPKQVNLLAVSKTKPADEIRSAFNAGQLRFGENYLQEALEKIQSLSDLNIEWHFIGAIQSNKTRDLAQNFNWVHSVDRLKIARRLSQQRDTSLAPLNICLQVNISNESSKSGFSPDEVSPAADEIASLPNIQLRGLMAIPAKASTFDDQRATFAQMKTLFESLQKTHKNFDTLSMGMSNDMEAAIAEGSTMLRIGTAIFGARNTSAL